MDSSISQNEIITVITIGIVAMLLFALVFVLFFYFSQKKFQSQKMKAKERELRYQEQLLYSSIEAQELERQRIARELHDEVGSKLNVLNLGLHSFKDPNQPAATIAETVDKLFAVLHNTIETTRRISHDLMPPTLENFGLAAALEDLCERYDKVSGISINFELEENRPNEIDEKVAQNLFRSIQELMSNSFKHAAASQIDVKLSLAEDAIILSYRDNGKGFDPQNKAHKKGLGMLNIESRMQMIEAEYELKSAKGEGIFVEIITKSSGLLGG